MITAANAYRETVRALIMAHPTFFCPISKEILDYRRAELVKFTLPDGKTKSDIVSHKGMELLKAKGLWEKLQCSIDDTDFQ